MGDLNNGTFQVDLSIPNVVIGPTDKVAFSYAIVNTGYDANKVEQDLKKAVTAAVGKASSAAGDATISLVGAEAKTWLTKLENLVFPNCRRIGRGGGTCLYRGPAQQDDRQWSWRHDD